GQSRCNQGAHTQADRLLASFNQALIETHAITLYTKTTKCHIKQIEKFWTESRVSECSYQELPPLGSENLHNQENKYSYNLLAATKLATYYLISPQTLKEIFVFIKGSLTKEYSLDNTKSKKLLLKAKEFIKATNINIFPNERQYIQVAAILLLAAYTSLRPRVLLYITYYNLYLYVEKHHKTGKHNSKTYTFHLNKNPVFCIITHMISITFNDETYNMLELVSSKQVFMLKAKKSPSQTVPWKQEMLNIPIFHRAIKTPQDVETSKNIALLYNQYHSWLVLLRVAISFIYTLTIYYLRRALDNAINNNPNSNVAEEYNLNTPILTIQQQLNGEQYDDNNNNNNKENAPTQTASIWIAKRHYIVECIKGYVFYIKFSINLIALYKQRDCCLVKTRCSLEPIPVKTALDLLQLSQIESKIKRDSSLSNNLTLEEREYRYKWKYTLQKHINRCRLKYYGPDDPIPCPDNHAYTRLILNGKMELKAHFAHKHGCFL
ncbi:hypothetical protein DPV78_010804, partial [Talaromyces pinophilus]